MNLNVKLTPESLKKLGTVLARQAGGVLAILLIGCLAYTAYFTSNLFYSKVDLEALELQSDPAKDRQIRFNQATLDALDKLAPSEVRPNTDTTGRANPFAPTQ